MTKQEQLELIRAKCIEANPEIEKYTRVSKPPVARSIRLADVLLAIRAISDEHERITGYTNKQDDDYVIVRSWNLRKDDLTEQSEECVAFLYELLQ